MLLPDKFKDALLATEVIAALEEGILQVYPEAEIHSAILSDGGDGFLQAVSGTLPHAEKRETLVQDPLGRSINAGYLYDSSTDTAYIEMAMASGIQLLQPNERDGARTTTYGTGELILHAERSGARKIYVGLGGSATNDGGIGLAEAIGYTFIGQDEKPLRAGGRNLKELTRIIPPKNKLQAKVYAVHDVMNPLFGPDGATRVYGPQKGLKKTDLDQIDNGMKHLHQQVKSTLGYDEATTPGSGAAGGTAYGLKVFADASFLSGTAFILNITGIKSLLETHDFDLIITGEGRIDSQTIYGKMISGVSQIGKKHAIPVVVFCGVSDISQKDSETLGLKAVIPVSDPDMPLAHNLNNAYRLLRENALEYFKANPL
nr:glycerate kinase [Robertkochia sp. 3YJGBD-33]